MSEHLIDSGIVIRHLRDYTGYTELLKRLTDEGQVYLSAMSRMEVVRGMREHERQETLDLLNLLETIPVNSEVADSAGELIRSWRTRGFLLGDADAIIAASALISGLPLVTTNPRHFPMPDLAVLQVDENGQVTLRE